MSERIQGWQQALSDVLRARWNQPFAWGTQDCVMFAADCVQAVTGRDPASKYRDTYASEASAARLMKRNGGMTAMTSAALGEPIPPAFATLGDIGLHRVEGRESLAVCTGVYWLATGPDGLVRIDAVETAWRCA